jgi:ribulose-5-phosphate 4-epimerase/fuculose-1-phosphate aldolase
MALIDLLHDELKTASKILEWEYGDIIGHIGVRLPENGGIAVKLFRPPEEEGVEDWLVHFDFSLRKLSGVGTIPLEATIYTETFRARPDVNAIVHAHPPMCVALSLADRPVAGVHMQSARYGAGVPIYPHPIFIIDEAEGQDLAKALGQAPAVTIKGHGIVTVGRSIDDACINAMYMERTAKLQAMAHALGYPGPTEAFRREMGASLEKIRGRGRQLGTPELSHSAEWRYYAAKVKKGEPWNRGWT